MKHSSTFLLFIIPFTTINVLSQNNEKPGEALEFGGSYTGEIFNNLSGGIQTGSRYLGMANITLNFDTQKAGLWKGGTFFINAVNTHGGSPSGDLTGDLQVASNIEAGNHTYIQELWFKQVLGQVEISAGLQDLNVDFVSSEHAGLYLNSSFGIVPTISVNIPASVFPLTTPGISVKWSVSENIILSGAAFDGYPTDFDNNNPYNLRWNINSKEGVLAISEFQYYSGADRLPSSYKLGFFIHNRDLALNNEAITDSTYENNYGFYFIADHILWQRDEWHKLGVFLQTGLTPEKFNFNNYYIGAGLNFYGLTNKNGEDALGLAIAHAGADKQTGSETTLELTYRLPITKSIIIQPDLQYIINPLGYEEKLENSFCVAIRFGVSFKGM